MHFSQEISENRPVKFIYQGRVLSDESSTLLSLNITDGCPVHVHVGRPRETPQQRAENEQRHANEFLDLSILCATVWCDTGHSLGGPVLLS